MTENPAEATTPRDELITSHLALVGHTVRRTMGRVPAHVSRDDLTSAGMTALVQAAQAFDATRGVPFARYAATRVRGAILDELRGIDWASRSVRRLARDLDQVRGHLTASLGRAPSTEEVASAAGLTPAEVVANEEDVSRAQVLSLHAGPDHPYGEVLTSSAPGPEETVEHRERLEYMSAAIAELPERLRIVVRDYFLAERPMAAIAAELGVTESRVSQMRAEALTLLKEAMSSCLSPELARPPGPARRVRRPSSRGVRRRRRPAARGARPPHGAPGVPRGHRLGPC